MIKILPNIKTCQQKIKEWKQNNPSGSPFFGPFWNWKSSVEITGASILDEGRIGEAACRLRKFLMSWDMNRTGVASVPDMREILMGIRPSYNRIRRLELGKGLIPKYTNDIVEIYRGLGGVTNNSNRRLAEKSDSSLTGKSKALLAIWGQTPGFDSIVKSRFLDWRHDPLPGQLPHLTRRSDYRYSPNQYSDIVSELDRWVAVWPQYNGGKNLNSLIPQHPLGYIIDRIYFWGPRKPQNS